MAVYAYGPWAAAGWLPKGLMYLGESAPFKGGSLTPVKGASSQELDKAPLNP